MRGANERGEGRSARRAPERRVHPSVHLHLLPRLLPPPCILFQLPVCPHLRARASQGGQREGCEWCQREGGGGGGAERARRPDPPLPHTHTLAHTLGKTRSSSGQVCGVGKGCGSWGALCRSRRRPRRPPPSPPPPAPFPGPPPPWAPPPPTSALAAAAAGGAGQGARAAAPMASPQAGAPAAARRRAAAAAAAQTPRRAPAGREGGPDHTRRAGPGDCTLPRPMRAPGCWDAVWGALAAEGVCAKRADKRRVAWRGVVVCAGAPARLFSAPLFPHNPHNTHTRVCALASQQARRRVPDSYHKSFAPLSACRLEPASCPTCPPAAPHMDAPLGRAARCAALVPAAPASPAARRAAWRPAPSDCCPRGWVGAQRL